MSVQEGPTTAFVFASGGSHGAVEVGMLKALTTHGNVPDFLVGSSVGAINAAFFAADPTPAGAGRLEQVWRTVRRRDVFPLWLPGSLLGLVSGRDHLVTSTALSRLLLRHFPYERLEDASLPCHVVATDLLQGTPVRISAGPVVPALLAATAIPAVFPPVRVNGRYLVDGAVASGTPLSTAAELGATRVIVLSPGFACTIRRPPRGVIGLALHALHFLIVHQLVTELEHTRSVEVVVVPPLCPLAVSAYDFSHTAELVGRAEAATTRWLEAGGLDSGGTVPEALRPHHH
jgi:NTE family protein